jgi:DNA processing protein
VGLWVRGPCSLRFVALRSVALVGARACTEYGAHVAAELGTALAERGWTVVSGAAYGIDGAAHRGALAVGGATIAVLACGVDVSYPAGHRELLGRIAECGLLVAELAPGDHPTRARFVQRNRVIAALTRGTVVVEAARRSGALITARHAGRLGRHLMAVPGPVTSGLSAGAHRLIREEATLVGSAGEIVELVGEMGDLAEQERGPVVARDLLAPQTARVLDALPAVGAADAEELARGACTSPEAATARLHELSSLGFVERVGDRWQLCR